MLTKAVKWGLILGGAGVGYLILTKKGRATMASTAGGAAVELEAGVFRAVAPADAAPYVDAILTASKRVGVSPFVMLGFLYLESNYGKALRPYAGGPKGAGPGGYGDFIPREATQARVDHQLPGSDITWGQKTSSGGFEELDEDDSNGSWMIVPKDRGWGHGLMQIDWHTWHEWLESNDWTDPATNIQKSAEIYKGGIDYLEKRGVSGELLLRGAIAAYNAGPARTWDAIAAGRDPDTATYGGGGYVAKVWDVAKAAAAAAGLPV